MKIEYDHSKLSMTNLHEMGIRSTKELEEVIEWPHSWCREDILTFSFPVFIITGLTRKCKGISVAITVNETGKFVTLDAQIPAREEFPVNLSR